MATPLKRLLLAVAVILAGCGGGIGGRPLLDMSEQELFEAGKAAYENGNRAAAREYLRRYEVRYPRGAYIEEAKYIIARTFYERRLSEDKIEGVALCRSFITFYPRHPRACDCQLMIAEYHFKRMRSPERDQSETRMAVEEARRLLATYPDCAQADEARLILAQSLDRLAYSEFKVGEFYTKTGKHKAAVSRFEELLTNYSNYTERDKIYYYLWRSLREIGRPDRAEEFRQQLEAEAPGSEYLNKMQ